MYFFLFFFCLNFIVFDLNVTNGHSLLTLWPTLSLFIQPRSIPISIDLCNKNPLFHRLSHLCAFLLSCSYCHLTWCTRFNLCFLFDRFSSAFDLRFRCALVQATGLHVTNAVLSSPFLHWFISFSALFLPAKGVDHGCNLNLAKPCRSNSSRKAAWPLDHQDYLCVSSRLTDALLINSLLRSSSLSGCCANVVILSPGDLFWLAIDHKLIEF